MTSGRGEPLLSLRSWLEHVDSLGEVEHVRGAHWNKEIGAISELSYRQPAPKALLFDEIIDYAPGQRILVGSTGSSRRLGHTLRLGDKLDDAGLVKALRGKTSEWADRSADYPVEVVDDAPMFENIVDGADVDLTAFPVPWWHELDGGRFIGTGCFVVTSDPETGERNGGAYRMQVQDDGRTATISAWAGKHGAQNIERWFERHGRAPVTVSFGHDPLLLVTGGTEVPGRIFELDYAGAIAGQRVPVVLGPDTGLPIPAGSEIALEGWLRPDLVRDEGPFGEWTGYYSDSAQPIVAMEIARLFYRNDPIQLGAPPGKPPFDYSYMRTVMKSAMIEDELVRSGLAGIKSAWAHQAGGGRLFIAVALEQRYAGHARQVGHLTAHGPAAAYMNRYVVVVDDDIDTSNLEEVVWAMCTRSDPKTDIEILSRTWGSRLDPLVRPSDSPHNSRAVIDACRPFEWRNEFPVVAESEPGYLRSVAAKWSHILT